MKYTNKKYFEISYIFASCIFVLTLHFSHFRERKGFYPNSTLTGTTARLSQNSIYNPDNYKDKKTVYARSLTDLANNLQVLSKEVDQTLKYGVRGYDEGEIDRAIEKEVKYQRQLRKEIEASQFSDPVPGETLRSELEDDELLKMYEERVQQLELSGAPKSPKESQWYVNPNHLANTSEAPTLQSIGRLFRYGKGSEKVRADKDRIALDHFPVTMGSSYEMSALDYPASEPLDRTAPPSMRRTRSKSASRLGRSFTFRAPDRSFRDDQHLDKQYLMTSEAPVIGETWFLMIFNIFLPFPQMFNFACYGSLCVSDCLNFLECSSKC